MTYRNRETKKRFDIIKNENGDQFDATEVGGTDKGRIDYEIDGHDMLLHTIFANPEQGSGLGSILMYLAVKDAIERECTRVKILSAAPDAREFYFNMGCRVNTDLLSATQQLGAFVGIGEGKILVKQCPIEGEATTVLNATHESMFKRWEPT